jgi:hypothetical protein
MQRCTSVLNPSGSGYSFFGQRLHQSISAAELVVEAGLPGGVTVERESKVSFMIRAMLPIQVYAGAIAGTCDSGLME